uniref:Uncharacterized protein, isoform C n=1 Tax=Drosophila melanogaster TaxID=7227 RepID=B8BPV3_DROME|nr:uncharacterized protein Dmel_CG42402, isoform C [Drosophila melanogaster]NP_001263172.1 uncharacterized protein Dmel_CG42402, isoform D [Drosophila melanogaster]EED86090.2 uncharacterized protein Dmel_CG42402, isoform C [Drosophila melanogaster]ELP57417.1 uncharacterized protein Dmel_CG42402, isoform D [Drosophila melanogaster]|eukprot:NP_001137538.2 uncharacterized protein Dmel_CG42402, isoform C [Drosophila melanogaster]
MDYWKARVLLLSFMCIISTATADGEIIFRIDPLALLSATLRTYQKAACDSDQVLIACPRGTSISIEFAQYNKFVAKDGYSIEELCPGSGEIRSEIRGRTKHLLRGSIFGSPPLKTPSSKYMTAGHSLAVPVQSVPEFNSSSATSSESISSVSPSVDDIQSTDYNTDNASENCMWPNALQYSLLQTVVEACQKKKHCKFHGSPEFYGQGSSGVGDSSGTSSYHSSTASSNAISNDPCPKRKKIVEVAYKCRPYEFRSKVACHNDVAQLECNPYSRIAVYSASFGRTEYESIQCPQPQGVREETCLASYATETVMQICHGRRRCNLAADANTFGSPCQPNSRMYLKVVYTCVPKQVLKENKALEVEADESEDFGGDLNDLYDDELIYKESEAIPKLYSNTTTTVRQNGTRSLGLGFSVNSANNQSITNSSLVVEGDRSDVNPVMTHSADLSLEEDQERLYFYLLALVSLGVLISIVIFGTRIALQKHHLVTETLSSSFAKTTRRVEETTIPSGLNDTISEIDAEIDLKTTLPLPNLSNKENYLTYAPTSSLYADLPRNQLVSACSQGSAAGQIGKPHIVGTRQSPDLIGITQGPFVTTSMASLGGQGPMAAMVTSAIVIGDSTPNSSSLGAMIPITQYTTAPTIRGGYVISADNMGVIQRANNTPTPLNLLSGSTPEQPPQAGPIISAAGMTVTPQAHGGASNLRRVKPPFLQPQLSYDGTAPRTLSTGVAVGSQFYYG